MKMILLNADNNSLKKARFCTTLNIYRTCKSISFLWWTHSEADGVIRILSCDGVFHLRLVKHEKNIGSRFNCDEKSSRAPFVVDNENFYFDFVKEFSLFIEFQWCQAAISDILNDMNDVKIFNSTCSQWITLQSTLWLSFFPHKQPVMVLLSIELHLWADCIRKKNHLPAFWYLT